jgi:hypothetical protein
MTDNVLIPLPGFTLPADYPWKIRFVSAVDEQLRRLRASGKFLPPRIFGYFFQGTSPVAVSGNWTVTLNPTRPISDLPDRIDRLTQGRFSIVSEAEENLPEFLLIHDRRDGACWLWRFAYGLQFVEATDATSEGDDGTNPLGGSENQKLLGP